MNEKERFMRTRPTISKHHREVPFKYSAICFIVRCKLGLI